MGKVWKFLEFKWNQEGNKVDMVLVGLVWFMTLLPPWSIYGFLLAIVCSSALHGANDLVHGGTLDRWKNEWESL
jgi:hypothetical protein